MHSRLEGVFRAMEKVNLSYEILLPYPVQLFDLSLDVLRKFEIEKSIVAVMTAFDVNDVKLAPNSSSWFHSKTLEGDFLYLPVVETPGNVPLTDLRTPRGISRLNIVISPWAKGTQVARNDFGRLWYSFPSQPNKNAFNESNHSQFGFAVAKT